MQAQGDRRQLKKHEDRCGTVTGQEKKRKRKGAKDAGKLDACRFLNVH